VCCVDAASPAADLCSALMPRAVYWGNGCRDLQHAAAVVGEKKVQEARAYLGRQHQQQQSTDGYNGRRQQQAGRSFFFLFLFSASCLIPPPGGELADMGSHVLVLDVPAVDNADIGGMVFVHQLAVAKSVYMGMFAFIVRCQALCSGLRVECGR